MSVKVLQKWKSLGEPWKTFVKTAEKFCVTLTSNYTLNKRSYRVSETLAVRKMVELGFKISQIVWWHSVYYRIQQALRWFLKMCDWRSVEASLSWKHIRKVRRRVVWWKKSNIAMYLHRTCHTMALLKKNKNWSWLWFMALLGHS